MGLGDYVKGLFSPSSMKLKALIVYPNKAVKIKSINVKDMRFQFADRTYIIDEKAIYFHKRKPMLMYHFDSASPMLFSNVGLSPSLRSNDINSILESKIVRDLLAATEAKDMIFYAAVAAAVLSLINALVSFGVIKVGG